jgi:K+-transporting ATPase KdpF subunit
MILLTWLGGALSLVVLVYLFAALLFPEQLS